MVNDTDITFSGKVRITGSLGVVDGSKTPQLLSICERMGTFDKEGPNKYSNFNPQRGGMQL